MSYQRMIPWDKYRLECFQIALCIALALCNIVVNYTTEAQVVSDQIPFSEVFEDIIQIPRTVQKRRETPVLVQPKDDKIVDIIEFEEPVLLTL